MGGEQISRQNPFDTQAVKEFKNQVKARHETFNGRLKHFHILAERFRHGKDKFKTVIVKHKAVFEGLCVVVQYKMENGSPMFDVV
jgi:hypothetical protein